MKMSSMVEMKPSGGKNRKSTELSESSVPSCLDEDLDDQDLPAGSGDELDNKNQLLITCPHKSRRHYAKNMCINCYHRRGRTKKAWACVHVEKLHYSKGLCQNCYLAKYYR